MATSGGGQGRPEVSVIIPTRDRWHLLQVTLGCALAQQNVALEVIVVDDGSTDGTAGGLAALGDQPVILCRNEASRGVAHARNIGIARARGEWVAFLDDDDLWAPNKLRMQIDVAREQQADFVYSHAVVVDSRCKATKQLETASPESVRARLAVGVGVPAGQSNVVANAEFVRALGGFDEGLATFADWDMWIRMAWAGRAATCEEVHVAYRVHAETMTTANIDRSPEMERMLRKHVPQRVNRRSARTFPDRWRANALRRGGHRLQASQQYLRSAIRTREPGMLLRAAVVLVGERAMNLASRRPPPQPAWLARHACDGAIR